MNAAWYALRRTLPPWRAEENLAELVEFCSKSRIDEVIIKVDTEEFSHGIPSAEWLASYLPVLKHAKEELSRIGVVFSINPWVTLVHCDRGRDISSTYPDVQRMVGHDGAECRACSCPISEGWRRATAELWRMYAGTEPDVIWVEDDIRLVNHRPARWGCFCPLHMKEFSRRVGREVTREEITAALFAPGEPHPWRNEWLEMNRELANDTVAFLGRTVHEVSPNTKLGLMCSGANQHALEGRNWAEFTRSLADGKQLVARPCMGIYCEHGMRDLYGSGYSLRSLLHCLGSGIEIQTELENFPFSLYAKSVSTTLRQLELSYIFGADGVTMNLYDHLGTPISENPEYGEMLGRKKDFLNALAERCRGGRDVGIRLLHNPEGSRHIKLPEKADLRDLFPEGQAWKDALEPMGFPVTFNRSPVTAVSGQVMRGMPEEQVKDILSRGVLLDLGALRTLTDMGYGDLLGVSVKREFMKNDEPLAAEEFFEPEFGGAPAKYMTNSLPDLGGHSRLAEITPAPGARVISRIVDADAKPVYPFVTLFENRLGGRVAVFPVEFAPSCGTAFLNPYRKEMLKSVVTWLGRGPAPMVVDGGVYPLPFRLEFDSCTVIGAFNLSLDSWPHVLFDTDIDKTPVRVEELSPEGAWQEAASVTCTASDGGLRVAMTKPLDAMSMTILTLWWKE